MTGTGVLTSAGVTKTTWISTLIAGNAEYKAQLESITRLGRALGVTLILAAQRPAGVTDQMRATIKFRICLRVETPDDSREVIEDGCVSAN